MKKRLVVSTLFFLFVFLAACNGNDVPIQVTVNPSAQPLLETMIAMESTVEAIGGSATAYAATLTPIPTPTKIPDPGEVNKTISNAMNDQLISTFGARITVEDVKFGPIGAQEFTNLYIEINCVGDGTTACPTTHVIIAVMDACKEKKKKVLENVPGTTQVLTITIFDPVARPKVVEINWSDVVAYINGDVPGEIFSRLVRYVQ